MSTRKTKRAVVGIVAHVDAGKTTLNEAILYRTGTTRTLGSVDGKDSHLDYHELEQRRGITIYAKQTSIELPGAELVLLDTPGHVDFSTEVERALHVLDYAVLVINGNEGIQGHTITLWRFESHMGRQVYPQFRALLYDPLSSGGAFLVRPVQPERLIRAEGPCFQA